MAKQVYAVVLALALLAALAVDECRADALPNTLRDAASGVARKLRAVTTITTTSTANWGAPCYWKGRQYNQDTMWDGYQCCNGSWKKGGCGSGRH